MGRGRALEVLLGADDFSADLAERYGWINRALPDAELAPFVSALAHRISGFPLTGIAEAKQRVNDITLPDIAALKEDSRLFVQGVARPESQSRIKTLFERGLQADGPVEAILGAALAEILLKSDAGEHESSSLRFVSHHRRRTRKRVTVNRYVQSRSELGDWAHGVN
jgi:hypothetical protein